MTDYVFKMPDIGEGIVEAEVVAWHVAVGDYIEEDMPLADVMTDKATVEITSPVAGKVKKLGCLAGDKMVIGSEFVVFDTADAVADSSAEDLPDSAGDIPDNPEANTQPPSKPKIRIVSDTGQVDENAAAASSVSPIRKNTDIPNQQKPDSSSIKPDDRGNRVDSGQGDDASARVVDLRGGQTNAAGQKSSQGQNSSVSQKLASPSVRQIRRR